MTEHVQAADLGVEWDPNAPEALLLSDDFGRTALALNPHPNDPDRRRVVLRWSGVALVSMAEPNDEAISGHPLYDKGLRELLWAGVVRDSASVKALETRNQVHPNHDASGYQRLTHYVILLKECLVEVIGDEVGVQRHEGSTFDALGAAIHN